MNNTGDSHFSIEQLAQLSGLSPRTIRFYIQMELVARPNGNKRGAWYDERHLQTLLRIKHLCEQGLSLDAVRTALTRDSKAEDPKVVDKRRSSITTRTHIELHSGIELVIDPIRAPMSPKALRRFAVLVDKAYETALQYDSKNDSDKDSKDA